MRFPRDFRGEVAEVLPLGCRPGQDGQLPMSTPPMLILRARIASRVSAVWPIEGAESRPGTTTSRSSGAEVGGQVSQRAAVRA